MALLVKELAGQACPCGFQPQTKNRERREVASESSSLTIHVLWHAPTQDREGGRKGKRKREREGKEIIRLSAQIYGLSSVSTLLLSNVSAKQTSKELHHRRRWKRVHQKLGPGKASLCWMLYIQLKQGVGFTISPVLNSPILP